MPLSNEEDIKKALDIVSWRNLSKDKLLTFIAEMPNMDKEVALKAIEQFPNFKLLVSETIESFGERYESAQKYSWKSQKKVHEAFESYRGTLNHELERENLSVEERFSILEMLREAVNKEAEKDSEFKAFTIKLVTIAATVSFGGAAIAVAALGGKAGFDAGGNRA